MSRRWTEDEATAPLDLRLVLPAVAVWAGCLLAVWAAGMVLWACAAGAVGLASCATVAHGGRCRTAAPVTALVCFLAAMILTALRFSAAAADPLIVAGQSGDWVVVDVTATADPASVAVGWTGSVDGAGAVDGGVIHGSPARSAGGVDSGAATGRWRIAARARMVTTGGMVSTSGAPVTVFADGAAWGSVRDGVTVRLRGVVQPDAFGTAPAVVIRARGDPETLKQAAPWTRWATRARDRLSDSARALEPDRGGLLRGLVVGDTRGIDAALSADAKTTGLSHLVAVSGSHMAIVAGLVLVLLRRFGPRVSGIGVAAAFGSLVTLVGLQPSVLRAVMMGLIGVAAAVVGRSRSGLSALAATVFALLLIDPTLAVSVGFALSVQATAGLILLAPVLTRALERRGVPRGWALLVSIPVAAHLATVPVITAISGRVSLVAIPANIAVAPVVAPALLLGLACLIAGCVWPAAGVQLARLDGPLLGWVTGTAHRLARWPGAAVPWSASAAGVLALVALIMAVLIAFRFRTARAVLIAAAMSVAVVVAAAHVVSIGWPGRGWLITMCDVGQGDGIALATDVPGEAVVIDTGPNPSAMDACLGRLGVTTIALLVITHLHADHVGGLAGAMRGRTVDAIAIGPDRSAPSAVRDIGDAARDLGITVTQVTPGGRWESDGLRLDVLGPARAFVGTDSDPNNDSVVLRATRRGVRMLLTGDIEQPAQQALLDGGADLHADVLKQPHHGSSKLLPGFLAAVGARVAVIGVGVGNDYGHPAPTALRRDRDAGVAVLLRTDTDGDAQVVMTDGGLGTITRGTGAAPIAD